MISKHTVMAFLVVSAVILACVLTLQLALPAHAAEASRAGDLVTATTVIDGSSEVLWMIDVRSQMLGVFGLTNDGLVQQLAAVDLTMIFQPTAAAFATPQGRFPTPLQPQGQQPDLQVPPEQTPVPPPASRAGTGRRGPLNLPNPPLPPNQAPDATNR